MQTGPSKTDKLLFWFILGAYSTFFAEVLSGSDLFPFFHPWGIIAIAPLYALHTLVLAYVVFRHGRPTLYALFAAGVIFGLYEAYITKVLWNPPYGDALLHFAGISFSEVIVLAFFWHPVMSFIIPVLLAETLLTNSRTVFNNLPKLLQRVLGHPFSRTGLLVLFTLAFALFPTHGAETTGHALVAGLLNPAVLIIMTNLWHKMTLGKSYSFQMLLPGRRSFKVLLLLLLSMYAGLGILLRPEALPGFFSHLIIWVIYGLAFWLLRASLKRSREIDLSSEIVPPSPPYKLMLCLWLLFVSTFTVGRLLIGTDSLLVLLSVWFGGGAVGIWLLIMTLWDARKGNSLTVAPTQ